MAITYRNNSSQFSQSGSGSASGTITWGPGAALEGDAIILMMSGTFAEGSDDSLTVTTSGFTQLGTYTIPIASASGTTGMKIACWGKIATASDISSGISFTFGSGFNTSLRTRAAVASSYSGTDDIFILTGPSANGFPDGGGTSFQFPNPGTGGVPCTVFTAGMIRSAQNNFPASRGSFTRRNYVSPSSGHSCAFLDANSPGGGAVTMPVGTTTTQAMGAISFALTDQEVTQTLGQIVICDDTSTMSWDNPAVPFTDSLLPTYDVTWEDAEMWFYTAGDEWPLRGLVDQGTNGSEPGKWATIHVPGNASPFDHHLGTFTASETEPVRIRFQVNRDWSDGDTTGTGTWFDCSHVWLEDMSGDIVTGTQTFLVDPN